MNSSRRTQPSPREPDPRRAASLERHGGHRPQGVLVRVLQLLALTAAIWHNHHSRQPVAPPHFNAKSRIGQLDRLAHVEPGLPGVLVPLDGVAELAGGAAELLTGAPDQQ